MYQVGSCLPDTHDLQSLLTADAGTHFKIPLQGAGRDAVMFCKFFNRDTETVMLKAVIQYVSDNIYRLKRTIVLSQLGKKIIG